MTAAYQAHAFGHIVADPARPLVWMRVMGKAIEIHGDRAPEPLTLRIDDKIRTRGHGDTIARGQLDLWFDVIPIVVDLAVPAGLVVDNLLAELHGQTVVALPVQGLNKVGFEFTLDKTALADPGDRVCRHELVPVLEDV